MSALVKSTSLLGSVRVPVLSMTIASTLRISSRAVASLMRIFFSAALPMPTIRAVGVASPIAQGQAITSTLTAESKAWGSRAVPPTSSQTANVTRLMTTTAGTKMRAMRSTRRWTGALEPCASCTILMICASIVLRPTSSALKRKVPCLTMVPASTLSPCRFSTATGSPEIIDSSMKAEASPSKRPSTGMRSPGRTSMVSPGCRTEIGASVTEPFSTR